MEDLSNLVWIIYTLDVILGSKPEMVTFILLAIAGLGILGRIVDDEVGKDLAKSCLSKVVVIPAILMVIFQLIVPSKETAYKMLAIYGGVSVIQSPEVQKLGGKGVAVLNKVMDEYLQEDKTDG